MPLLAHYLSVMKAQHPSILWVVVVICLSTSTGFAKEQNKQSLFFEANNLLKSQQRLSFPS